MSREPISSYYELHITMEVTGSGLFQRDKDDLRQMVEEGARYLAGMPTWKFSAIDGDPILGDGVKCYATTHLNATKHSVADALDILRGFGSYLRSRRARVLREKIEMVLYDEVFQPRDYRAEAMT